MAHDVFISYSSQDKPVADAICAALEARRIRCWIAPRDVPAGVFYAAALVNAISRSRLMVLVFSSSSNNSLQVVREVERAASRALPIIPFRIEDTPLCESLEFLISGRHWLDALTPPLEKHIQELCESVERWLSNGAVADDSALLKQIRELSKRFYAEPLDDRIQTTARIAEIANKVKREPIKQLCRSEKRGERVAGFICLGVHLGAGIPACERTEITAILELGIRDKQSRVRFRALEASACDPGIARRLLKTYRWMAENDENAAIRELAVSLQGPLQAPQSDAGPGETQG